MELMETLALNQISADDILQKSGISKGSMYHHFTDLDELLETAQVARFAHWVDVSINNMSQIIRAAKSKEELFEALRVVTENTQSVKRRPSRIERASALSKRNANPRYKELIGKESDRLMSGLEDLARESQEKGYFTKMHHPRTIAMMVQAYTLGKIVDDYSHKPVPDDEWNALIMDLVRKVFMQD